VRDRNWGTILPEIVEEKIEVQENSFEINYTAHYKNVEIDFIADYQILGKPDGSISLSMKGKALYSFLKNRIGFCILHPLQGIKGQICTITNSKGQVSHAHFPTEVSAKSPMKNIKSMEWSNQVATCQLDFEGDIWETEDQRNWTDSSFKTFCTPLSIPYPVHIEKDTEINQRIVFSAQLREPQKSSINNLDLLSIKIDKEKQYAIPKIGLAESTLSRKLFDNEVIILREANFYHLRFDLKFSEQNWQEKLDIARYNAQSIHAKLELVLHFSPDFIEELQILKEYALEKGKENLPIAIVWTIDEKTRISNDILIEETIPELHRLFPKAKIGGGTDAYFAEFNRNIFDATLLDFVTFAASPQVHAFDNDTLVENIESQYDVLEGSAKLYQSKALAISPITLKQRFNVVATGEDSATPENQLSYSVDERQMSLFAAGWTLGSLGAIIKGKCHAVTYYETVGWRGIIQGENEPTKPHLFASKRGDIFPIYHVLRLVNQPYDFAYWCESSSPLKFSALVLGKTEMNKMWLLLANHTPETIEVKVGEGFIFSQYQTLDEDSFDLASHDIDFLAKSEWKIVKANTVELKPYALAFSELLY
jgi:D-apionolactonase